MNNISFNSTIAHNSLKPSQENSSEKENEILFILPENIKNEILKKDDLFLKHFSDYVTKLYCNQENSKLTELTPQIIEKLFEDFEKIYQEKHLVSTKNQALQEKTPNKALVERETKVALREQKKNYIIRKFFEASAKGDLKTLMLCLSTQYCNIHTTNERGETALFLAIQNGHRKLALHLLQLQANPNIGDHNEQTPLYAAVQRDDTNLVSLLLNYGANIHLQDSSGRTILHYAAHTGSLNSLIDLLENGLNILATDHYGFTCIDYMSEETLIQFLDIIYLGESDDDDDTPNSIKKIMHACVQTASTRNYPRFLQTVFDNNDLRKFLPDVVQECLSLALQRSNISIIKILSQYQLIDGEQELIHAFSQRDVQSFNALLEAGINPNTQMRGNSLLLCACCFSLTPFVKALLEHGAHVNIINSVGCTTLHSMVILQPNHDRMEMIELLLQYHADPLIENTLGYTALNKADELGLTELKEYLLTYRPERSFLPSTSSKSI